MEIHAADWDNAGENDFAFLHDIRQRRAPERESTKANTTEQERVGLDIHDGIGQQLTAIDLLAGSVEWGLAAGGHAAQARQIGELREHLKSAIAEAQGLSRSLTVLEMHADTLGNAESDLADRITDASGVNCIFHGPLDLAVDDDLLAARLYRIAQEAVYNAVKHAAPQRVDVDLVRGPDARVPTAGEDELSFEAQPCTPGHLGLHIMCYRAGIIGARLTIAPSSAGKPGAMRGAGAGLTASR